MNRAGRAAWLLVLIAFAATASASRVAADCNPSVPEDEVGAIGGGTSGAASASLGATGAYVGFVAENATDARDKILDALPGAILLPFSNLNNIVTATGAMGSALIGIAGGYTILLIQAAGQILIEKIHEAGDCV